MVDHINTTQTQALSSPQSGQADKGFQLFGDDGLTFWDVVDMVNPLQHIPVVSTAYRAMTGDELDPGARLVGSTLLGGPIGFAAAAANIALEHETGKDAGNHVLAWFDDAEDAPLEHPTYAQNQTPSPAQTESPDEPALTATIPLDPDMILTNEADAFAAGEASLSQAPIQQAALTQPPVTARQNTPQNTHHTGSAGTWQPTPSQQSAFVQNPSPSTPAQPETIKQAQTETPPNPEFFKAQKSHLDSLDALRAFARDLKTQQGQTQGPEPTQQEARPQPTPLNPIQASPVAATQDNDWFVQMMSNNMDRYKTAPMGGQAG